MALKQATLNLSNLKETTNEASLNSTTLNGTKQDIKPKFTELNNLTNGGKVLFASDDFFAAAENLLKEHDAEWKEGVFDPQGKWMDGWETRRKRIAGNDFCLIKLRYPSVIYGIQADTSFFTGNYTPRISLQAGVLSPQDETRLPIRTGETNKAATPDELKLVASLGTHEWQVLVPKTSLGAGYPDTCDTFIPVNSSESWTHLRLNYYPDGGVARLRIFGHVKRTLEDISANGITTKNANTTLWDLASMEHGAICIGFSNAHYGHPRNILQTRPILNIGDGWETARRLDRPSVITENSEGFIESPGEEWAAFRLGVAGKVMKVQVDTTCYKGNFPDRCKIEACFLSGKDESQLLNESSGNWKTLVPFRKLHASKTHMFSVDEKVGEKISHLRIKIAPDGGIARIRVWGIPI